MKGDQFGLVLLLHGVQTLLGHFKLLNQFLFEGDLRSQLHKFLVEDLEEGKINLRAYLKNGLSLGKSDIELYLLRRLVVI